MSAVFSSSTVPLVDVLSLTGDSRPMTYGNIPLTIQESNAIMGSRNLLVNGIIGS